MVQGDEIMNNNEQDNNLVISTEQNNDAVKPITTEEENTIVRATKPESINERYSKIMQLRKDIANGKIIKVYVGDGKFVWKRIR